MEYRYRSIPHNCSILDKARLKPVYGEFLELYGFDEVPYEVLEFRKADEDFLTFVKEAKRIRGLYTGLEIRRLDLGLEADGLREAIAESGNRALLQAIIGGDILGVSICSTNGDPIRFLPPYSVKRVVAEFDRSYRIVSSDLEEAFNKLATFYRFAAAFDEGVLTIKL
ncbi:MAG TPA: hypothetical protein VFZ49_05085 [Pyrinomonadaceae bacterium]